MPLHICKNGFMQRHEPFRGADSVEDLPKCFTSEFLLESLVFELDRGCRIHEVAGCHPSAWPHHGSQGRERLFRGPPRHIEFVKEPSGVDEVEYSTRKQGLENVSQNKLDRSDEFRFGKKTSRLFYALCVVVEGGKASIISDTLTQALYPEQGGAARIENVEAVDISEKVKLPVAEGYQVRLELLPLFRRQRVSFV